MPNSASNLNQQAATHRRISDRPRHAIRTIQTARYPTLGTRNRCCWLQITLFVTALPGHRRLLALLVDDYTTEKNREHNGCEDQEGTIHG
jgi:hypothetical protein